MKAVTRVIGKQTKINASEMELNEKLLSIDRVTKVVKGGRRLHFRALVIVGDQDGHVGVGLAKASGVPEAIHKASAAGRRELIEVPIKNTTIPHEILAKFGASKILMNEVREILNSNYDLYKDIGLDSGMHYSLLCYGRARLLEDAGN